MNKNPDVTVMQSIHEQFVEQLKQLHDSTIHIEQKCENLLANRSAGKSEADISKEKKEPISFAERLQERIDQMQALNHRLKNICKHLDAII